MTTSPDTADNDRFLLVDDDKSLTAILARALQRRGFPTVAVDTDEAAMAACEERAFAKAIVDLKLAESSGLQLVPRLLAIQPALDIVILTGYSSIATAVEAIKLGASNYLCKPADVEDILAAFSADSKLEQSLGDMSPPSVDRLEWEHIQRVLQEQGGNISATARALGMHRRTLQRKLNKKPVKR